MACDLANQGLELGPESKWRLDRAYDVYAQKRALSQRAIFTFSAGMAPRDIFPYQTYAMGYLQIQYLSRKGVADWHLLSSSKTVWGSRAEVEEAFFRAKTMSQEEVVEFIFVSSWYHIPRLRLLLWQYRRKGELPKATIRFVASRGRLINALKEAPKLIGQFLGLA
jgi:uncharacterized SAM-binding protein YcdF (DUF218 family)